MKRLVMIVLLLSLLTAGVQAAVSTTDYSKQSLISLDLINQDPDPANAGDLVELRLGVSNQGGVAATDVTVELVSTYPFELVQGQSAVRNVGTLSAYQQDEDQYIIKYEVRVDKDATAGSYELKLQYRQAGTTTTLQKSVWVDVSSKDSAEVIYIDQVELIPGKVTPLSFTINNVGSAPLRDLSFQWENAEDIVLPVGSDNTRYIKYVDVGQSAELSFNVIASASADPDLYKLDLTLTYDDPITGEEKEIATKAGVYVGGATDFDVAYSDSASGEYSFSIANIGSVSATSVVVHVPSQQGWRVSGTDSVIIGNLNKGDYTIASFTLQQTTTRQSLQPGAVQNTTRTAVQNTPLELDIIYTDSRGNRNTVTKEVNIASSGNTSVLTSLNGQLPSTMYGRSSFQRQSTLQRFWNQAKWVIIVVAALVVLFLGRRKYKREKLDDPSYTVWRLVGLGKKRSKRK